MKKLLIIAFIGLFSIPSQCINRSYVNGKYFSCDGNLLVRNGEAWCNGEKIDASTGSYYSSWSSYVFGNNNAIQGSGTSETKQVPIKKIKNISASGIGNLFIEQCNNPQNCIEMLSVTADDNILPYLTQDIHDDKLTLGLKNNVSFTTKTPIYYHATVKDINTISNSGSIDIQSSSISTDNLTATTTGSGDITIRDIIAKQLIMNQKGSGDIKTYINTDKLKVNSTGSGDMTIGGKTHTQEIKNSGSGDYKAKQLKSTIASVSSSGSGDISLGCVTEKITGYSSGSGDIFYSSQCNPSVNVKKTGSGKLKKSSW